MTMVMIINIILFLICCILITLSFIISKKSFMDREKASPFECGFDPKSSARLPFSLQFFLIAVIFLIFDVEITLLIPLILTIKISNLMNYFSVASFFLLILLIGLYHEWNQGALTWAI
uniref:NADH dehydrogenase subunit 3 n=1 Tax=Sophrops subrugatus TaxID=2962662 RepID=UPI0021142D03|nr:NADH dehydrogenase subunit 3 [Sophrops subrugatus]YP_010936644.1 NADH dehydrogenase subunit 3 [Sophrops peronosporus]UTE83870.1 NADH dehydrogenase subunit 3 [Sophrops subrugatus]WKW91613.1 NADH dehydrogenase subunit 3 [Sophrops peronosporus]